MVKKNKKHQAIRKSNLYVNSGQSSTILVGHCHGQGKGSKKKIYPAKLHARHSIHTLYSQ